MEQFDPWNLWKIEIPSRKALNIVDHSKLNVHFNFAYEDEMIFLKSNILANRYTVDFRLENHIVYQALVDSIDRINNGDANFRIHQHELLESQIDALENYILNKANDNEEDNYYIALYKEYNKKHGIGLIVDQKTNEEIATFESLSFMHDDMYFSVTLDHIITTINKFNFSDYMFSFYSLEDKKIFTFSDAEAVEALEKDKFQLINPKVKVEQFPENHEKYRLIQEQNAYKDMIKDTDISDVIGEQIYHDFKEKRLAIIKDFKQVLRKEKIYQEFADIDL